jgi:hypothetical protein
LDKPIADATMKRILMWAPELSEIATAAYFPLS